jgi:hypothetical protein
MLVKVGIVGVGGVGGAGGVVASSGVTAYPAQFELLAIACPRLSTSIAPFVTVRPLDAAAL